MKITTIGVRQAFDISRGGNNKILLKRNKAFAQIYALKCLGQVAAHPRCSVDVLRKERLKIVPCRAVTEAGSHSRCRRYVALGIDPETQHAQDEQSD